MEESTAYAKKKILTAIGSPRKRPGRPPKTSVQNAEVTNAMSEPNETAADELEIPDEHLLTVSPTSSECRRSSRKKIIKFEVLNVLNKNRKPPKIQIEARIDSNVPQSAATSTSGVRAFVMQDNWASNKTPASAARLPPPALEIFAKPKPTQSLIVAQVSSEEPPQSHVPEQQTDHATNDAVPPTMGPRKRGRPRKVQPTVLLKDVGIKNSTVVARSSSSFSDSDTSSTNSGNSVTNSNTSVESIGNPKIKKSKLRVSLKRMSMPVSCESSDSGEFIKSASGTINLLEVFNSSSECTLLEQSPLQIIDELTDQPLTKGETELETDTITLLPADDEDSDSQIIFVAIESAKSAAETDSETRACEEMASNNFKLLFPKEQREAGTDESEIIVEVLSEPPWSADGDDEQQQLSQHESASDHQSSESNEMGAITSRRSKRTSLRGSATNSNSNSKMTLEETFAEIAAETSKQTLESEAAEKLKLRLELDEDENTLIDLIEDSNSNSHNSSISKLSPHMEAENLIPEITIELDTSSLVQFLEPAPRSDDGHNEKDLTTATVDLLNAEIMSLQQPAEVEVETEALQLETDIPIEESIEIASELESETSVEKSIEDTLQMETEMSIKKSIEVALQLEMDLPIEESTEVALELKSENSIEKSIDDSLQLETGLAVEKTIEVALHLETDTPIEESIEVALELKSETSIEKSTKAPLKTEMSIEKSIEVALQLETELHIAKAIDVPLQLEPATYIEKSIEASSRIETEMLNDQSPDCHSDELPIGSLKLDTTDMSIIKAQLPPEKQQQRVSRSPTPTCSSTPKSEKLTSVSIVECDAMFKAIDKASAQIRSEEKIKKKQKLSAKKQTTKLDLELQKQSDNGSPTMLMTVAGKDKTRRFTISEAQHEQVANRLSYKRRNSLHPGKASHSAEPVTIKTNRMKPRKQARKSDAAKNIPNSLSRQDSLDSSSSASQCAFKRKTVKVSDALLVALAETESSESTSSGSKLNNCGMPTPTSELEPDPLKDIAKFIEDGVKLLERDYKPDEEQQQQQQQQKPLLPEDEFAQRVANMETPATTPSTSPQSNLNVSTTSGNGGVRRSHRIKQKPQQPKSSVGRRVASISNSSQTSSSISMEDQLAELAHIDAINEQFLRHENLNTYQPLRDNYYRCARQVSQENAEMQCDCFLTGDEEAQGHLSCGAGCINRMLMIECGPLCTNGDRCTNKRFQQHKCWPCRVFRTEKKGCGITAELQIPEGEFIMEYVGEVIDSEEFERRQHLYSRDRNRHYYFMALRGEAIIDATAKGNISRYINHSCDPNAETQKWTVNGELRIGFFSVKTIMPGEEITFDYQYQRYGRDAQRCFCEAVNCRGWIGGEPDSDEGEQLDGDSDSDAEDLPDDVDELEMDRARTKSKVTKISKSKPSIKQLKLPTATRKQRKEQPKSKDREYKAGRWLRPSGAISSSEEKSAVRKPDKLEDPDVLEQLTLLNRSGLKNQPDTLRFSRCMVRTKLLQTRIQLLGVLTRGELPCRRLFLDYHGLRLLHAWISESGNDNLLRLALLEALESLPIPNKTMLNDTRVYQSVQLWTTTPVQAVKSTPATNENQEQPQTQPEPETEAMRQRMLALLQKWNALPEIFRIPKRERIEQMKEHEREADRQHQPHHVATALEDSNSASATLSSDRYRPDRFRRDTSSRYEKPKLSARMSMSGNNTICTITTSQLKERNSGTDGNGNANGSNNGNGNGISKSDPRRRSDLTSDARRIKSKELRRTLFERKVAQDEAEKRVCSEDWREHELRCEYFGADLNTDPKLLPFYQNTETNEWFNSDDMQVPTPLRCGNACVAVSEPLSPESIDGVEYKLPAGVEPLPASWHWNVNIEGEIYYYNIRDRISQWEPPNAEQRMQNLIEDSPLQEFNNDPDLLAEELINIDIDYVGNLSSKSLAQYVEAKVRERRELRKSRLVSVCVISPRREEDRIYNQLESRKYKENKEKIRRRKEIYRRKRNEANTAESQKEQELNDSLPIQGYLYSSDEEVDMDIACSAPSCVTLPLLDAMVDLAKDTRVDEAETPSRSHHNKLKSTLNSEPSTSKSALSAFNKQIISLKMLSASSEAGNESPLATKRKLPMPQISESHKKSRSERDKKRKSLLSSTSSGRESCEKFRFEISGHVAEYLRPYRKEACQLGRITCDEDYKFLIKRLSHHITTKEMRYCDVTGNPLACTESVKHKSYDFINQYMRKKGTVYKKPADEPDY